MAVPVIPPPPGVMFEGGYHIQKNPINGAAVLVPPKGLLFQCSAISNNGLVPGKEVQNFIKWNLLSN